MVCPNSSLLRSSLVASAHQARPERDAVERRAIAARDGVEGRRVQLSLRHRFQFEGVHQLLKRRDPAGRLADDFLPAHGKSVLTSV